MGSSAKFWTNVYKLWLSHYAQLAQAAFQQRIKMLVSTFNDAHSAEGVAATCRIGPVKTYERMKKKELAYGKPTYEVHEGRWVASQLLDPLRASVVVSTPKEAMMLLEEVFRPLTLSKNRMELVQVVNGFNKEARPEHGYRDLVLNIRWDGGVRAGYVADVHLCLIAEIRIILQDFLVVKKQMRLIDKYLSGDYDHDE